MAACPIGGAPLTTPHSLQWCFLLVMELKVSPQPLQLCFSLSRLVFEDGFLDSSYKEANSCRQSWKARVTLPLWG